MQQRQHFATHQSRHPLHPLPSDGCQEWEIGEEVMLSREGTVLTPSMPCPWHVFCPASVCDRCRDVCCQSCDCLSGYMCQFLLLFFAPASPNTPATIIAPPGEAPLLPEDYSHNCIPVCGVAVAGVVRCVSCCSARAL